jgi:hypothetical protein
MTDETETELRAFVRDVVSRTGFDNEPPPDEAPDGEAAGDDAGAAEYDSLTPRQAWDRLDDETQKAIAADPKASAEWRRALAGEPDEGPDDGPIERMSSKEVSERVGTLVGDVLSGAADPIHDLIWIATASPAEWREWAQASGVPEEARPGYADLPPEVQVEFHRQNLQRKAAELARTGRYLE